MGAPKEEGFPVFVYGTLRPGFPLWQALKGSVVEGPFMAWARGYRLAHSAYGNYPVMVPVMKGGFAPERKIVRGTLVYVRNDAAFKSIWDMEVAAGYEAEMIRVYSGTHHTDDEMGKAFVTEAFAFIWRDRDYGDTVRPRFVESDIIADWGEEVARLRALMPGPEEIESIPSQKKTRR